jgi:hypothetical protein
MPLFNEYDNDISDDDLQQLEADLDIQEPPPMPAATAVTGDKPAAPKPAEPKKDLGSQVGDAARNVAEGALAAPTAVLDFGVDLVNLLPKKNLPGVPNPFHQAGQVPKVPAFKNEVIQSLREVASIVLPSIFLTKAGIKAGGAAAASNVGSKLGPVTALGKDILFQKFARMGVAAGVGGAVDYVAKPNQTDHNAAGSVKKMWPKTFGWISNDWATVDGDSPEVFREKNVKEGVGLNIFVDLAVDAAKIIKSIGDTKDLTKWLPKDAKAKSFFERLKADKGDTDALTKGVADHEEALDELGDYRSLKPENLDQPTLGIHDLFDDIESGIRTVDEGGVAGAMGDAARIQNNTNTRYGRLRNFISEPALKNGLKADNLTKRTIVEGVQAMIAESGKFDYLVGNKLLTQADIEDAGTDLARIWLDADLDVDGFKALVEPFRRNIAEGVKSLDDVGYRATMEVMKEHLDKFVSLDSMKAAGLTATQKAGQLADTAAGAREMAGTAAIERAQEQILDIMEFLMVEKGVSSYMRGRGLANIGFWNRVKNTLAGKDAAENALEEFNGKMSKMVADAKEVTNGLREISKERPEFLEPLHLAWELTDGDVNTLAKLNNYVAQSLPNIQKALVDNQPEIPNVIVQGAWSNIFNSALSALATTGKAFWGNTSMLMVKPVAIMGGALASGDIKTFKRAWYGYSAVMDTSWKAFGHFGQVFKKVSMDPKSVEYVVRKDLKAGSDKQWRILDEFAKAASQRGNDGPRVLYETAKTFEDLSNHPVLRFGSNGITATDGFARAVVANVEARTRVYDKFITGGEELNGKTLKEAANEIYQSMHDKNGLIQDEAIKYAVDEIALNLDNAASEALGGVIRQFPIIRPFMMFPRASTNLIAFADKFSPYSVFLREYNELTYKNTDEFPVDEITSILKRKGIPVDASAPDRFHTLVAEARGRKALGTMLITGAGYQMMSDSLTGDGYFDKEVQKTREGLGWKKRQYKGWDGKWYSYDNLGPISDIIAAVATTMDHFDTLDPKGLELYFQKAAFVVSTLFLDKSMLTGAEAMLDILRGNPAAANRWAAGFVNNFGPLGGARAEFGRNVQDGLRELDMDFMQLMRNRNNWIDLVDGKGALPYKYSWLTGEKVSPGGGSFWQRAWNSVMPMKIGGSEISPEAEYLMDIEFDSRPGFMRDGKGNELDPTTRAELYEAVGKQGVFLAAVKREMNSLEGKAFRQQIKDARKNGGTADKKEWNDLFNRLDKALDAAKKSAMSSLPEDTVTRLYQQEAMRNLNKRNNNYGIPGSDIEALLKVNNP